MMQKNPKIYRSLDDFPFWKSCIVPYAAAFVAGAAVLVGVLYLYVVITEPAVTKTGPNAMACGFAIAAFYFVRKYTRQRLCPINRFPIVLVEDDPFIGKHFKNKKGYKVTIYAQSDKPDTYRAYYTRSGVQHPIRDYTSDELQTLGL